MKNQRLILIIGLSVCTASIFAQNSDQPLIGHSNTTELQAENASKSTENNSSKSNSFSIQAGIGQYNFYDSGLYGEQVTYQSNGVYSGVMSGFRDLYGLYVKGTYFFNENVGITADIAFQHGENGSYIQNATSSVTYETSADLNFQRIGLSGRFIGEKYPIKLSFNSGVGRGVLDAYYLVSTNTSRFDYEGKVSFPMVYFQTDLTIPVYKGLFIFSQYEYTVGWTKEFSLVHNNGGDYHEIYYRRPGLGGNNFRFGLGYEFGR
jgi:hypothetical protein